MPWKEVSPMEQKMQFVSLAASGRFTVSQLCEDFEISRKTGHKWLSRYAAEGECGLSNLSRRPRGCSHQKFKRDRNLKGNLKGEFKRDKNLKGTG